MGPEEPDCHTCYPILQMSKVRLSQVVTCPGSESEFNPGSTWTLPLHLFPGTPGTQVQRVGQKTSNDAKQQKQPNKWMKSPHI